MNYDYFGQYGVRVEKWFTEVYIFSLQVDGSMDISNTAQLLITVMMFSNFSMKEEFLMLLPLKEWTKGEDI
jgi:hypothetical protein